MNNNELQEAMDRVTVAVEAVNKAKRNWLRCPCEECRAGVVDAQAKLAIADEMRSAAIARMIASQE